MRVLKLVILAAALAAAAGAARAQDPAPSPAANQAQGKSTYEFDQAIQSYLKGDSQSAISHLDDSLKQDPNNQRAKVFLLKILVERGSRLFVAKQYAKAYDYLSRAYHMDPGNEQVRQMFDMAAKQVAPQQPATRVMLIPKEMQTELLKEQAAQSARAQGAPNVTLASADAQARPVGTRSGGVTPMYAEPAPMEAGGGEGGSGLVLAEQYAKNAAAMMNLLNTFQQRQERQMDKFMVPMDRLQHLYYQSEQDRKNFINQLDGKFKNVLGDMSAQKRMVTYGFLAGLIMLGFVVWGFYMVILRMRSKREELVMKYQQEMLKMVRDMAALPGSGGLSALPYAGNNYRLPGGAAPMLPSSGYAQPGLPTAAPMPQPGYPPPGYAQPGYPQPGYPQPGAYPVQPEGMAPNPGLGAPAGPDPVFQLDQIILTGNLKERALAAVHMLNLNADRALDEIQKMIAAEDPFQRENMAFALGEQYHPMTLDLLKNALVDTERRVALAAYRALKRLERQPENTLAPEARDAVVLALKNAPADLQDKKRGGAL